VSFVRDDDDPSIVRPFLIGILLAAAAVAIILSAGCVPPHPKVPIPPDTGKLAAIAQACRDIYWQELQREPSIVEMTDCRSGFVGGATDVEMRDRIHAGAEWIQQHSIPKSRFALVGPLRAVNDGDRHYFADDSGPRRVLFTSWFPALRIFHDNPDEARAQLDAIARAGYQGIRIFRALGADRDNGDDDSSWWSGRTVNPAWAVDALIPFLQECQQRDLRVALTEGHAWNDPTGDELAFTQRVVEAIHAQGFDQVVAVWENWNEGFQNTAYGDSSTQLGIGLRMFDVVRAGLEPDPVLLQTSFNNEDPATMVRSAIGADAITIHGDRYWPGR
jgi:hypothetical protein